MSIHCAFHSFTVLFYFYDAHLVCLCCAERAVLRARRLLALGVMSHQEVTEALREVEALRADQQPRTNPPAEEAANNQQPPVINVSFHIRE